VNVLCLDQFSELGGAQRCLLDLLPALVERGWSVHVAAAGGGPLGARAAALGATADAIHCGPYSSGGKTPLDMARFAAEAPSLAGEIRRLARRYRADLIYVNGPRLLPAVALAGGGGPVLFHAHSRLDGYALRLAGWAAAMRRAALMASCRFVAAPLEWYAGGRGVRVVYNGVREMAAAGRERVGPEFRIGVVGRIAPEKGQADFLRAARLLDREMPGCRFVICGAPLFASAAAVRYGAELEALAARLPVEFTGWQDDVESVLTGLDLLVAPSTAVDATPRVILEAFAAGVPVVAFAAGGIPEIVEHNATGFLVEQRSPEALAAALRDVLRAPGRMREVAEAARAKARRDFSVERYRAQMVQALEAAAAR